MSYSGTALLALLVHIIINLNVLRNTHYQHELPAKKAYRGVILSITLFYVFDALWGVLYEAHLHVPVFVDTVFYFIAMAASIFMWTRFIVFYLKERTRFLTFVSAAGWVMLGLIFVLLVLNFFQPVMFWFDGEGAYHTGRLRYLVLAVQILLYLPTSLYVLLTVRGAERKTRHHHYAIFAFGLTMTLAVILQVVYPLLPMYTVGCLLGTCILHTFVLNDMKDERQQELEELLTREQAQRKELGSARHMAYTDSLTGVKNTHAYVETEKQVDQRIAARELKDFGVVVFDLNNLKQVNDTLGHEAGDDYIRAACRLICHQFKHSPVFRIGGDEFVALLEGEDFKNRKELLESFESLVEGNLGTGKPVVASGLAVFRPGHDNSYRRVFERADQRMYDRKSTLKAMRV